MDTQNNPEQKKQASHFMAFYVVGLFSIALVLILLSYMTQVRADDQVASAESRLQEQVSATQGIQAKMEIMQETSNEQAQRIAELEQSLSKAEEASATLDIRAAAQTQLIRASAFAMAGQTAQVKAEIDSLIQNYTLEALDGSKPEDLIWGMDEINLFTQLRALGEAGEDNNS